MAVRGLRYESSFVLLLGIDYWWNLLLVLASAYCIIYMAGYVFVISGLIQPGQVMRLGLGVGVVHSCIYILYC
jgi:hypothetical protein